MDLVDAQQARRVLDRIVGYSISPILWKSLKDFLQVALQSVALKLIIDRENEINKPEEYWTIDGVFKKGTNNSKPAMGLMARRWSSTPMKNCVLERLGQRFYRWEGGKKSVVRCAASIHHLFYADGCCQ